MSTAQINTWWCIACALVVIGAGVIHLGFGIILTGVLLGAGVIRAELEKEKEHDNESPKVR